MKTFLYVKVLIQDLVILSLWYLFCIISALSGHSQNQFTQWLLGYTREVSHFHLFGILLLFGWMIAWAILVNSGKYKNTKTVNWLFIISSFGGIGFIITAMIDAPWAGWVNLTIIALSLVKDIIVGIVFFFTPTE